MISQHLGLKLSQIVRCNIYNFGKIQRISTSFPTVCFNRTYSSFSSRKNNVILMGSPGSGKTTVGRLLGLKLGRPVIDVDNDFLESHWGMTVAKKLEQVGGENFVEAEGKAFLSLNVENSVISLSGSNPMYPLAAKHMKSLGPVIFLDVQQDDILRRLEQMKVNRIVGQTDNIPMSDILQYRQQFYEGNYDIRVLCEGNESAESIAEKVELALNRAWNDRGYTSTRGEVQTSKTFNDVVLEGLAEDGGLYVPENDQIPQWSLNQWERLLPLSYPERALRILETWINHNSLNPAHLSEFVQETYSASNFDCHRAFPVVHLQDNLFIGELFHGPTASFKDAALQLMPKFFNHAMQCAKQQGKLDQSARYLILVATSGDTGGAVLYGFNALNELNQDSDKVKVLVLYPEHGISDIQKIQMTTVAGDAVHVVGVDSDFDFCQSSIKQIFRDSQIADTLWKQCNTKLSAANSINWGRLLPQVVYHGSLYLDMVAAGYISMGQPVDLCIPTGNYGNILAAYYAKLMGIPFNRLICASNENNVLTDFFTSGVYDLTERTLKVTATPAIDILRSSNLERFLYHKAGQEVVEDCYGKLEAHGRFQVSPQVLAKLKEDIVVDWCTEKEALSEINNTFHQTGYLLDPHTAVAMVVAHRKNDSNTPLLVSSTAHYAKFADHVLGSVNQQPSGTPQELFSRLEGLDGSAGGGVKPKMHRTLKEAMDRPVMHHKVCTADIQNIKNELIAFAAK